MKYRVAALFVLCCATAQAQQMAITFDDLPAHGEKPASVSRLDIASSILATLKRENMPPTYGFINGVRTQEDPGSESVLKAWRDAGQPLGNHTWAHKDLESETPEEFEADVLKDEPLLEKYMAGQDWRWFRYPFLHEGETTEKYRAVHAWLDAHHYKVAEVSMDFEDYLWNAPYARCVARNDQASIQKLHDSYLATADQYISIFRQLSQTVYGRDPRYILLMHLGAFDAHMLPELLALYRQRGFTFISLPEAAQDPIYSKALDPDIGVKYGGGIQELMMAKLKLKFPPNSKPYKELEATCK
jgi:peptidoglycan/xylan/chitin deacetylase (PgdA/CDA1 family)